MLTKMEVYNPRASSTELLLGDGGPSTDPIQIRGIEGLGPVLASVNTTPYGSFDGESYKGSSIGKRNIVLTLGLNPDWVDQSMTSLRELLYAYFMPKQPVKLRFLRDILPTCEIVGYVESFEPNIFSKDPEVQISVICPLPDFVAVEPVIIEGTVDTEASDTEIMYSGNVSTGFVLAVEETVGNPSYTGSLLILNKTPTVQSFTCEVVVDATKFFKMSTVRGKKYVQSILYAGGVITNLLNTISVETIWPQLEPGINEFSVIGDESGQDWTITYYDRFGGL